MSCAVPVGNQEGWDEGEESDDDVEHGGPGDQGGWEDPDYRTTPHLVSKHGDINPSYSVLCMALLSNISFYTNWFGTS